MQGPVSSNSARDEDVSSSLGQLWDESRDGGTHLPDGFTPTQRSAVQSLHSSEITYPVPVLLYPLGFNHGIFARHKQGPGLKLRGENSAG